MKRIYFLLALSFLFTFAGFAQAEKVACKSVSADEFKKIVQAKSTVLIDVRTSQEFAEGHIAGALNIDVNSTGFVANVQKLGAKKTVALYCRSGRRSKMAASLLSNTGCKMVELKNGFNEWMQMGLPVVK